MKKKPGKMKKSAPPPFKGKKGAPPAMMGATPNQKTFHGGMARR